jgi:hypothetical protein
LVALVLYVSILLLNDDFAYALFLAIIIILLVGTVTTYKKLTVKKLYM